MKKVLSTVAAFGLVMGVAATASALELSATGYYKLEGKYLSDSNNAGGVNLNNTAAQIAAKSEGASSQWWQHDFRIYPVMKVNDNITMKADVRLISSSNTVGSTSGVWGSDTAAGVTTINARKAWMEYMSPVGKITMGRTPGGAWGSPYLNSAGARNRLIWEPNAISAPWSLKLLTEKTAENDGGPANGAGTAQTDQDTDNYLISVGHTSDIGKIDVAWWGTRNGANAAGAIETDSLWLNGVFTAGPATIITEWQFTKGDTAVANVDIDSHAGMILAMGKASDNLTIGGVYFMATGEDNNSTDTDAHLGNAGTGFDWEPTYIMTGDDMGVLNGDSVNSQVAGVGVHAFGVFADLAVNPKTTLHACIATGKADDMSTVSATADDDFGVEYNLGLSYKLLDNLTYDLHFGYWKVGDAGKLAASTSTNQTTDVTLLTHSLTMKF